MQDYIFTLKLPTRVCKDTPGHVLQILLSCSEKSLLKYPLHESILVLKNQTDHQETSTSHGGTSVSIEGGACEEAHHSSSYCSLCLFHHHIPF